MLKLLTKRGLSALLVLVMVLSMVPFGAFATEEESVPESGDTLIPQEVFDKALEMMEEADEPEEIPEETKTLRPATKQEVAADHQHSLMSVEREPALCEDPGVTAGVICSTCGEIISGCEPIPALGHDVIQYDAKLPTFSRVGWEAYEACSRCAYSTYVEIPMLDAPPIDNYESFLMSLILLEDVANSYAMENPGKDPLDLMIKYIRTGVDRYNSGSWGIMAGYEDAGFAEYVALVEDVLNSEASSIDEMFCITNLKDIKNFMLPNGEMSDIGHMFGTMDITYHNKFGTNHADVGGWAGDLVDLLEFSDYSGISGSLNEMIDQVNEKTFLITAPEEVGGFNKLDMIGDLDALYLMEQLRTEGYHYEFEVSGLAINILMYFTEDLSMEDRADFFLRNRLDGVSTRSDVRDAVYQAYINNKVVTTLEATRDFKSTDLENLRKAVCYTYADYICKLAGDYVENPDNQLFTVFSTESAVLAPGITQQTKMATTADGKQIVYYLATGDLTREDVNLYANYNNNDPSEGWAMQRVLDQANAAQNKYGDPESPYYIENYNVVVSTNGAGYNMQTGQPSGLLVMGGVEYSPISGSGFFGVLKDGTAVVGTAEEYKTIYKDQVRDGIAIFGAQLIRDGKIVPGLTDDRASRTAIGITKTGKVVMMVLDGRQEPFSAGGGYATLAQILLEAGCVEAVNMDGGGSTTFVAKMPGEEELAVISRPSDGFARSVASSWMLVSTAPSSTKFDHAVLQPEYDYLSSGASVKIEVVGVSATGNNVDLPEGLTWAVSDETIGQVSENGVFTAIQNGDVEVYLMLDGMIVGSTALHVVIPDNLYFNKTNLDTVFGETKPLPLKLLYMGKEMAFVPGDVVFSLSNSKAGVVNGISFVATSNENAGVSNVTVTASLAHNPDAVSTIKVALYKQGELSFDFDQATGGDRQLAWQRVVSNAVLDDGIYILQDSSQDMITEYVLAIDMTQIPIPARLEELTYMLPGSDIAGASAWTFLCQLAERISDLSEIQAVVRYDSNLELDISEMKLINDYFILSNVENDTENSTLTLTLNWKKQSQAIPVDTANPLCLVNGLKLTVKDDAQWNSKKQLKIINTGDISYKIYMRASALYSFSAKPENQEIYGLYAYMNPANSYDKGGYFQDTYKEFYDSYTLQNSLKEGWYNEEGGFTYYVAGQKLTGVHQVDGVYYNFGANGVNQGKTPYSGMLQENGKTFYAQFGKLVSGWYAVGDSYYYFDPANFAAHTGVSKVAGKTYTFDDAGKLVKGAFYQTSNGIRYYWAGQIMVREWVDTDAGKIYINDRGYQVFGNFPVIENSTEDAVWMHFDEKTGALTGICDGFVDYNGDTYYCINGEWYYGALETEKGIIFCGTNGMVKKGGSCYISDSLEVTAGLQTGFYAVTAEGYLVKDGFAVINGNTYHFTDYVRAKGFTKVGDKYYFFNAGNGIMFKNANLWVAGNNPYGIEAGYYTFQADGSMYEPDPNGEKKIISENGNLYFTIDGVKQKNGLNELDGEYYYANTNGTLVVNKSFYLSRFNDLIDPGKGYFGFDAEGKLIKTGFVLADNGYYYCYQDLVRQKGFTKIGDKFYFFNNGSGAMQCGATLWVAGSNPYGFEAGYYIFQADGTMYIPDPNGEKKIVSENGKLYFTIDGMKQKNGLNELDGEYYYATSTGALAVNTNVYLSKFNDLIAPGNGYFGFGSDGKMIKTGFVAASNGYTYYYEDLVRAKGFTKVGDKFYFFNNGSGAMQCNVTLWVAGSNPYGFEAGYYNFQADGSMYIPDPNGEKKLVEENGKLYITIDGVKQKNGLNELNGEYYYANANGTLAVNTSVYLSKFNDLIAPGNGYFGFGSDGKMIKTGFVAASNGYTYYYENLVRIKGLVKIGSDYYYFNTGNGAMTVDATVWVGGNNSYGIKGGMYHFDSEGKMVIG